MATPLRRTPAREEAGEPDRARDETPDAELMLLLCTGDERALGILIDRYGKRIRTYLGHIVRDQTWADDLTQEVFVRVYESAPSYDENYAFSIWLFRIARNLGVDLLRRQGTQQRALVRLKHRFSELGRNLRSGHHPSPLRDLESREFMEHFQRAVQKLPEPFRSVFVLREVEGMSYEEIASVVAVSAKTVSTRLHRARRQLRRLLAPYLDPAPADVRVNPRSGPEPREERP